MTRREMQEHLDQLGEEFEADYRELPAGGRGLDLVSREAYHRRPDAKRRGRGGNRPPADDTEG